MLHLADNALVIAHRNSEWCGHGPVLEQDIALTNIALDLLGQARNFYQYAATCITAQTGQHTTEDQLAYWRDAPDFRNCLLVEQPNGHWGVTITRQFLFSTYQFFLYSELQHSSDATLAAITAKALKEVTYHVNWSGEWMVRLGDGTEESHRKMQDALELLWPYTAELFQPAPYETQAMKESYGADLQQVAARWTNRVKATLEEATLAMPEPEPCGIAGKSGAHTHLEALLQEMQVLQRTYPGATW